MLNNPSETWVLNTVHDFGPSSATLRLANEFLTSHSLGEFLPYRCFEPETQIFYNLSSLGFVIETLPLVGCGEEIPRQLTGLFQHSLPLGSNLQCLLIASSRIEPWLKGWESARRGRSDSKTTSQSFILEELSKERCSSLRGLSQENGVRTFRLLISYSEPSLRAPSKRESASSSSIDAILALREQFITNLKGWGLPVKVWNAEDLLNGLDELLNPSDNLDHSNISWNPYDALSNQLMSPSSRLVVEPSQLIFGEEEKEHSQRDLSQQVMRLYTPRLFPATWHLGAMNTLIGDPFDEFLRLQSGFFISYGVHVCNEKTLKTRMLAKCGNVEKQAASPIAKYVPSLKKEEQEWRYVREKFEEGQRLVRTRFQVGLLCDADQMPREEQTLFNLYRSQRWELALDRYLQLPAFLSCLPMTWGEGGAENSQKFQKTKTTLSHEPANLMPLQGEWQGTKSPGMMLVGRRGQLFYWSPFDNNTI